MFHSDQIATSSFLVQLSFYFTLKSLSLSQGYLNVRLQVCGTEQNHHQSH